MIGQGIDEAVAPPAPPAPPPSSVGALCPYCGAEQATSGATQCSSCRGLFEPLSRQATQNAMGPWHVRDESSPFRPGCGYETLRALALRGKIDADTPIRGPTTKQFWARAGEVPGVAHLLGRCHACRCRVRATDSLCDSCGAAFSAPTDRQRLGLGPVRPPGGPPLIDERAAIDGGPFRVSHHPAGERRVGAERAKPASAALPSSLAAASSLDFPFAPPQGNGAATVNAERAAPERSVPRGALMGLGALALVSIVVVGGSLAARSGRSSGAEPAGVVAPSPQVRPAPVVGVEARREGELTRRLEDAVHQAEGGSAEGVRGALVSLRALAAEGDIPSGLAARVAGEIARLERPLEPGSSEPR